jgi:hypothetical protein
MRINHNVPAIVSVTGVESSGRRVERVQNERRAEEARAAEQRSRSEEDQRARRSTESGRGENMDVTA